MTRVPRPRFCVVPDPADPLPALLTDLERRFGRDYEVTGLRSPDAEDGVQRLSDDGRALALLIVDERGPVPRASVLLGGGRRVHPQAKRTLLVRRGNWSARHPVVAAM